MKLPHCLTDFRKLSIQKIKNGKEHFKKVMAEKVLNIKVCSPLKQRSGLAGNYHANCHYSYNLPLPTIPGRK